MNTLPLGDVFIRQKTAETHSAINANYVFILSFFLLPSDNDGHGGGVK